MRKLWSDDLPRADHIKTVPLARLLRVSRQLIHDPGFRELLEENKDFNRDFTDTLVYTEAVGTTLTPRASEPEQVIEQEVEDFTY